MEDMRRKAKVPYGYDIVDGAAVINEAEAAGLKLYFRRYHDGDSMAEAARKARLPYSPTSLPHLFQRKEYVGTDYYPAIITPEYQKTLIDEWERRKGEKPRNLKRGTKKAVRIYTDFKLVKPRQYAPDDAEDCAAALYQRIRPNFTKQKEVHS